VVSIFLDASDKVFEIARHFREVERIKQLETRSRILRSLVGQVCLVSLPVTSTNVQCNRVTEEKFVGDKGLEWQKKRNNLRSFSRDLDDIVEPICILVRVSNLGVLAIA